MSVGRRGVTCGLLVAVAFLGGVVSAWAVAWTVAGQPAWAQGAQGRRVVKAQEFVLVDGAGKPRASLRLNDKGQAGLDFWDDAGERLRARMGLVDGVPGLAVYKEGRLRAWLYVADGRPEMEMWDAEGRRRPFLP